MDSARQRVCAYVIPSTSSSAFYVYSAISILNVPPIEDDNGELQCAITSTFTHGCGLASTVVDTNPNVQAYFESLASKSISGLPVRLPNSGMGAAHNGREILFTSPFVYLPEWAIGSAFDDVEVHLEMFGFVPRVLLSSMIQDPVYVAKYPPLPSCLLGGPSLDEAWSKCVDAFVKNKNNRLPHAHVNALEPIPIKEQMTSSLAVIQSPGCFHPGACPTSAIPGATVQITIPASTTKSDRIMVSSISVSSQVLDGKAMLSSEFTSQRNAMTDSPCNSVNVRS